MFRFFCSFVFAIAFNTSFVSAENVKLVVTGDGNWQLVLAKEHVLLRGGHWFVIPPDAKTGGWAAEHAKFADEGYTIVQHGLSERGASVQVWAHADGRMMLVTMRWLRTRGYTDYEQPFRPEAMPPRRYWEAKVFHSGFVELVK